MTTASDLADELARMFAQFRSDLSTAHEEICKLQGLNPMEKAWPEWSPQANTLRWIDRSCPAILSALRRVEKLAGALEPFAKVADEYDDREDDSFEVWLDAGPLKVNNVGQSFRLANYRAARQALTGEA